MNKIKYLVIICLFSGCFHKEPNIMNKVLAELDCLEILQTMTVERIREIAGGQPCTLTKECISSKLDVWIDSCIKEKWAEHEKED